MDDAVYERLFAGYRKAWVDLNGDGVPDAPAQPTQQPQNALYSNPGSPAIMPDGMPTGVRDPVLWSDSMPSPLVAARDMLGEVSGAYGVQRGAKNIQEGMQQGSPMRVAGGAAEAGLSMLPYSGAASRAAFATVPRAMGTGFAIGGAPVLGSGFATPANAAGAQSTPSVDNEGLVRQYSTERAQIASEIAQARQARDAQRPQGREPTPKSDPKFTAANNRVTELEAKASGLDTRIKDLQFQMSPEYNLKIEKQRFEDDAAQKLKKSQTPFREQFPEASQLLPAIGLSAAFGIPFAGKALQRMIYPGVGSKMASEVTQATNALARNDAPQIAMSSEALKARLASGPDAPPMTAMGAASSFANGAKEPLMLGVAGAGASAEASMYPDQYDAANLPDGPLRDAARARSLDPINYLERGLMGALAANSGSKLGQIATPKVKPDYAAARGAVNAIENRGAAASAEAGVARGAADAATARAAQFTAEEQAAIQQAYARAAQGQIAPPPNMQPRQITPQQGVAGQPGPMPPQGPSPRRPTGSGGGQNQQQGRGAQYSPEMSEFNRGTLATAFEKQTPISSRDILDAMQASGRFPNLPSGAVVEKRLQATADLINARLAAGKPVNREEIMALVSRATLGLAPVVAGNALSSAQPSPPNALSY
jgi:hypothetical protein